MWRFFCQSAQVSKSLSEVFGVTTFHLIMTPPDKQISISFCVWSFVFKCAKYWLLPCSLLLFSPEVFGRLCPTTFHLMMTPHRIKKTQFRFVSGVSFSSVQSTGCCPALCLSSLQRSLEALLYYLSSHDDFPQNKRLNFVLFLEFRFQVCRVLAISG